MLYMRHVETGINQWALGVVTYSSGVVDWTWGDLNRIDVKTSKILTSNRCLYRKADAARFFLKRKYGERELISVENCVFG